MAYFDVDDTLIIWVTNMTEEQEKRSVKVTDSFGDTLHLPNTPMIEKLKDITVLKDGLLFIESYEVK